VPQALDVNRILADQLALESRDSRLANQPRTAETDARHVLVRFDFDDAKP
jgi:hypothetical protein